MKQNNFIVDQCGTLTPSSTKELVVTIHGTFSNEISCFLLTVSTNLFEHFSTPTMHTVVGGGGKQWLFLVADNQTQFQT